MPLAKHCGTVAQPSIFPPSIIAVLRTDPVRRIGPEAVGARRQHRRGAPLQRHRPDGPVALVLAQHAVVAEHLVERAVLLVDDDHVLDHAGGYELSPLASRALFTDTVGGEQSGDDEQHDDAGPGSACRGHAGQPTETPGAGPGPSVPP